ncbi:cupin domain-containing protein [Daejeonella sp.]|uniref:cupin domain-containing protein n=1 Tax=Daejeonella sp. TaxID=2805397 RepID=UPI0030BA63B0
MKAIQKIAALILLGIISFTVQVQAQMTHMAADHIMVTPDNIKWVDGPPSLPAGAKMAVIEGSPAAAGLFTMRLKLPANYTVMPHSHPADEHVTVISGTFFMGLGETLDRSLGKGIPKGGFAVMMTGTRHYAFTKKESIIQIHGMGPWGITYVNAADDPRNKK